MAWAAGAVQSEIVAESILVTYQVPDAHIQEAILDARLLLLIRSLKRPLESQTAQLQLPDPFGYILTWDDPKNVTILLQKEKQHSGLAACLKNGPGLRKMTHAKDRGRSRKTEEDRGRSRRPRKIKED